MNPKKLQKDPQFWIENKVLWQDSNEQNPSINMDIEWMNF